MGLASSSKAVPVPLSESTPGDIWTDAAPLVRTSVPDAVWQSTFAQASGVSLDDDLFVLGVPNGIAKAKVDDRYREVVLEALTEVGPAIIDLRVDVVMGTPTQEVLDLSDGALDPHAVSNEMARPATPASRQGADTANAGATTPLAPTTPGAPNGQGGNEARYTFEGFVTGASNRFAHAAALAVAETPGQSYNPLFIYGDAGLGKTHLLQAIAHYVRENYPSHSVRYVSTESFLNEFVSAIRTNDQAGFKQRYRQVDVLLVDDIQFIEGKEGLQEELFHTFNSLHDANKQIILSSDRPPDAISTLEDRLRSRFMWGLLTDIQPPDVETRMAILYKKAERSKIAIPDEVLRFIATHVTNNIRELEGALVRVQAWANLNDTAIDPDEAERILRDIVSRERPRQITPEVIFAATEELFGFPIDEIKGRSRRRPLVTARQISMYVFRELTELSYPQIAREFGGRDHTTVIHAVEKIKTQMTEKRQVYDQVSDLTRMVTNERPQ